MSLALGDMDDNRINVLRPSLLKPSFAKESPTRMFASVVPGPQSIQAISGPRRPFTLIAAALLLLAVSLCAANLAHSQASGTVVLNATALHPPAGARVAIVEFDDLQCPSCAAANPTLMQAAATYHIPWIRHDFLIPYHNWSRQAALNARWFDSKSKTLGDDYRNQVFAAQQSIYNPDSLRQFTEKFAQSHSVSLPFAIDPQGKFAAAIDADVALGNQTGVHSTPTIFVVTSGSKGPPYIEVTDRNRLFQIIDQALAETPAAKPAVKPATASTAKKPATH
jgi:protein-disulfide isomerase